MLIAAKVLGATVLAGALTASGVLTTENLTGNHETAAPVTTPVPDPHATFRDLAVGGNTDVSAGDAGTVTVTRTSSGLEIGAVAPAAGWTSFTKRIAPDWILVTFESPGRTVELSLDLFNTSLRIRQVAFDVDAPTTATTEAPTTTTTTTEAPTATTTPTTLPAPLPPVTLPPVTLAPPVQPTVIPVAGAGTVVIVMQGPIVVVRDVKALPGWEASVARRAGDVDVLFHKGDRTFRFFASMAGKRLTSAIREDRPDGARPVSVDGRRDGPGDRGGERRDGGGRH